MNVNELQHITAAASEHNITIASLLRMDTEGLVRVIKRNDDYFIVASDLRRVAELARDNPQLKSCECIGGNCKCDAGRNDSQNSKGFDRV